MPLDVLRVRGNPNIGVYIFTNNKIALVPKGTESDVKRKIKDTLSVEVIEASVDDSPLLGVFLAGNDNVILAPRLIREEELEELREAGLKVHVVHSALTALGNVVLANNRAAIFHKELEKREVESMVKELGVSRYRAGSIAGIPTVGSVAVITDRGGVVHPDVGDDELKELSEFFGVPVGVGTVNFGVAFIKTGLVANNYGALVGDRTTGPEIMRIMKALNMEGERIG